MEPVWGAYLRKQLQQIPILIEINQNIQRTNGIKVFMQLQTCLLQPDLDILVVCIWDFDELDASCFQVCDVADDIVCSEGNMLHAGAVVEVHVLFDLGLLFTLCGLVDGHLDNFVRRGHDDAL